MTEESKGISGIGKGLAVMAMVGAGLYCADKLGDILNNSHYRSYNSPVIVDRRIYGCPMIENRCPPQRTFNGGVNYYLQRGKRHNSHREERIVIQIGKHHERKHCDRPRHR